MKDEDKTKGQLIEELSLLRREMAEIKSSARSHGGYKDTARSLGEALRKIEDEKAKTESILAAIGDGIRILDTKFRVIYENRAHRELLGSNRGEYCYRAYRNRESVCPECPVALSIGDGVVHTVERSLHTSEGMKYLEITASHLRDSEGQIVAGIEVIRDISERKRMEAERERLITELQNALGKIKTLKGLIPVCAWCKKVRDDKGFWEDLENYVRAHSDADFTHGICPECLGEADPESYDEFMKREEKDG